MRKKHNGMIPTRAWVTETLAYHRRDLIKPVGRGESFTVHHVAVAVKATPEPYSHL